ncbi:MAG: alpha/beta hydrolase [bacterium]
MNCLLRCGLAVALLVSCAGCANGLFYHPTRVVYQTPAARSLKYEDVTFTSPDGTRLNGWFIPAVSNAHGTVIHFHGNAQNMTAHFTFADWVPEAGFNLFVFDYRGYGKSEGRISRRGVYEDSVAAIRYVQGRADVDPDRILIFGQSLGGANAIAALGNNDFTGIRAIVIDSSFYSYRRIVRDKIALIPVLSLLRWPLSYVVVGNAYSPANDVARLPRVPIVFIHGTADTVVPYEHSVDLYEKANPPKSLWMVPGGEHTEALTRFRDRYLQRMVDLFEQAVEEGCQ